MCSESTLRSASSTRRILSLIGVHHLSLHDSQLPFLRSKVPLDLVQQPLELAVLACYQRDREPRALPDVVMVDLRDGGAHVLQALLGRAEEVPLLLERVARGEVQLGRQD